jgi:predicted Fe-Mo cluster-binding NifX family protein
MSKVAVMMSENNVAAPMSLHFGKANWIMTADTESHTSVFLNVEAGNGKSVADLLADQGCTDAVFSGIGNGALARLEATNIRGWIAPPNNSGQQALQMFGHLRLQPATPQSEEHSSKGCCCTKDAGTKTASCCHGSSPASA